jgi:tetratricopeptide (TPR) repeat protein
MSISPAQDADPNEAALLTALERARALADAGQYVASLVEAQRLLKLVPRHPHILHLSGVAHVQLGNQLLAMKHLDLALQQLPGFAMLHAHRGEALRRGGLLEEAVQSCRRALELDPGCREARHNLVVSLLDLGQPAQALAELDTMPDPGLPDPQQLFQRARALIDLGRAQPAAEALQALVAVEPHVAEAWSALAVARLLQDDLVGARAAAERATSIAPGLPQGWLQAGDTSRASIPRCPAAACR